MKIDLSEKITTHFKRLEDLADSASKDEEESYSSRASAMSALTSVIKELTKTQSEVVNMERLMHIEQLTIETLQKHLTHDQMNTFLDDLSKRFSNE